MPLGAPVPLPSFLAPTEAGVRQAAQLLCAGELVALPTETVYGLAANALNDQAVQKIFSVKGRPLLDPLIVHGLNLEGLSKLAHFTPAARKLAEACWPGPLTLILRKTAEVSGLVTAGRDTVALRVPAHPVMRAVLTACQLPLAAPSANPFGYISPTRPEHVRASFGERVPWIMDGGPCSVGLESTIVDVSDPTKSPCVLRPGPITPETIAQILGTEVHLRAAASDQTPTTGLVAPGLLARHYSPRTPLTLLESGEVPASTATGKNAAWVRLQQSGSTQDLPAGLEVFWLGKNGDLAHAAQGLYDLLRRLDEVGYERIWCEQAPESGWGLALNDRLRRAAGRG